MSEYMHPFTETLSFCQIDVLKKLFNWELKKLTLDIDETLLNSQDPVKAEFDRVVGTNYIDRKIDQWLALSHWAEEDGIMSFEEAKNIEGPLWINPDILAKAKPILEIQEFSAQAVIGGVNQVALTSRNPELHDVTVESLKTYYPWIKEVKIRNTEQKRKMNGDIFKGMMAYLLDSNLHIDDSPSSIDRVISMSEASAILFPRAFETKQFTDIDRVIELPDMSTFRELYKLYRSM